VLNVTTGFVPPGGTITWVWSGLIDPATIFVIHRASDDSPVWSWMYTDCSTTQPAQVVASGTCGVVIPALPAGQYVVIALHPGSYLATSNPFTLGGETPTPTPTATSTVTPVPPTATPAPT